MYLRQLNFNRSHAPDPPPEIIRGNYHQATAYDPFLIADFGVSAIVEASLRDSFFGRNYAKPSTHAEKVKVSEAIPRSSRLASKLSLRFGQMDGGQIQATIDLVLNQLIGPTDKANSRIHYFDQLFDPTIEIQLSVDGGGYMDRYREYFIGLMNHDLASPYSLREMTCSNGLNGDKANSKSRGRAYRVVQPYEPLKTCRSCGTSLFAECLRMYSVYLA